MVARVEGKYFSIYDANCEYVIGEVGRLNRERLASVHAARRKQQLESNTQSKFIHAAIGENKSYCRIRFVMASAQLSTL